MIDHEPDNINNADILRYLFLGYELQEILGLELSHVDARYAAENWGKHYHGKACNMEKRDAAYHLVFRFIEDKVAR